MTMSWHIKNYIYSATLNRVYLKQKQQFVVLQSIFDLSHIHLRKYLAAIVCEVHLAPVTPFRTSEQDF